MAEKTTVGIEIEFTGMDRAKAKDILCKFFGTNKVKATELYNKIGYEVRDKQNRVWQVVYDGSINSSNGLENTRCELVTPILYSDTDKDLDELCRLVDTIKGNGGYTNDSCGLHVHVGAGDMNGQGLKNLLNLFYSRQNDLFQRFNVKAGRAKLYCKKTRYELIKKLNQKTIGNKFFLKQNIKRAWYEGAKTDDDKLETRYHALNFHCLYSNKTVEFRLFNGTLDSKKIKAYAKLCAAMKNFANKEELISSQDMQRIDNKNLNKKQFDEWLTKLGIPKTERKVLLNLKQIKNKADNMTRQANGQNQRVVPNFARNYQPAFQM
jgi:truncated hemoglobin YjbI